MSESPDVVSYNLKSLPALMFAASPTIQMTVHLKEHRVWSQCERPESRLSRESRLVVRVERK